MTARTSYVQTWLPIAAFVTAAGVACWVSGGGITIVIAAAALWLQFIRRLIGTDWSWEDARLDAVAYLRSRAECPDCGEDLIDCRCGGGAG